MANSFGLNKKQRLEAEREERRREEAKKVPPLDPKFPFSQISFDPEYYQAEQTFPPPPDA